MSDDQLNLIPDEPLPIAAELRKRLEPWTKKGIYFGTSSWKYEGWLGQIYNRKRYEYRDKFALTRFKADCITEYADTFPFVGGDFTAYTFYDPKFWNRLFEKVPPSFLFGMKVPDKITSPVFPKRMPQAGEDNPDFLNADLLQKAFLDVLKPHSKQIGLLAFQFPQLRKAIVETFPERLDKFFGSLPTTCRYAVEIRNEELLKSEHFKVLKKHNIAHVFNSWTRMPTIGEQMEHDDAFTTDLIFARALLRPGRSYEQAVGMFEPYEKIQDPYPEGYKDVAALVRRGVASKARTYIAVNNRFVGNAIMAIEEILKELESSES